MFLSPIYFSFSFLLRSPTYLLKNYAQWRLPPPVPEIELRRLAFLELDEESRVFSSWHFMLALLCAGANLLIFFFSFPTYYRELPQLAPEFWIFFFFYSEFFELTFFFKTSFLFFSVRVEFHSFQNRRSQSFILGVL